MHQPEARLSLRTRVKVCGITRTEDAAVAAACGADAIGLVFHPASRRAVEPEAAAEIARAAAPLVTVVGLFMDAPAERVRAVLERVPLELLQFHGEESPEYCESFGRRYIKAVAMGSDVDVDALARVHARACGFLLDAHRRGEAGGSGRSFDWARVPSTLDRPRVLAGGLTPQNVAAAVRQVRPFAVDVASGVEASPGIKDPDRIAAFIEEVNRAHSS